MSDVKGMDALQHRLKAIGETQPTMRALQLSTIHEGQQRMHRKTGHMQRSTVPGPVTETTAIIEVRTPYAAAQEYGAKPHIIKPKNARVLAWGGARRLTGSLKAGAKATHFATIVHHPGNKANPALHDGFKAALAKGGLIGTIVDRWNRAA